MVTKVFVAKVSRIRNTKNKDYFVHRINLPTKEVNEMKLEKEDYVLLKAKKAEWYHMLDWSKMDNTWNRLPPEIRNKIKEDGLLDDKSVISTEQELQRYVGGAGTTNPLSITAQENIAEKAKNLLGTG